MFAQLRDWNVKLDLEVGAVKPWGPTGQQTFHAQQPMWDRFLRLGADLHGIAMDEPLNFTHYALEKPVDYAVQETADFIARVRRHYPNLIIGDIETYPSLPIPDHFTWIDALQARLATLGVRGLDYYRLDTDWVSFTLTGNGSWREVKTLEDYCRGRELPFSLIYWASNYPWLQRRNLAADDTWYVGIMSQANDYVVVDGAPDEYVIESWVGAPEKIVPDSADFTFTRSVRDFLARFVDAAD